MAEHRHSFRKVVEVRIVEECACRTKRWQVTNGRSGERETFYVDRWGRRKKEAPAVAPLRRKVTGPESQPAEHSPLMEAAP